MKAHRNLLSPALSAALALLMIALLGGVALSAAEVPHTDPVASFQRVASFQAEGHSLQGPLRSFHAEVRGFQEWQRTADPREKRKAPKPALLADIPGNLPITARPGKGKVIGQMPAGSRYFGEPHKAWIQERSTDGRYGRVAVPYSGTRAAGWIRIAGLDLSHTPYRVSIDLSRHLVTVLRLNKVVMSLPAATGAPASPTPPGRYFVTDLVTATPGGSFGSYAFGLSGIQPKLPVGWSGGDQLAIHGTNDPSSIGTAASAGCLRVSERALDRLKPVLRLGTPVVIKP
ncbi:MAG: L,D-transpeptidase [Actinomycetota bacterium]|nr:L,D-transpeptidase [Actinomycetota bacterium]